MTTRDTAGSSAWIRRVAAVCIGGWIALAGVTAAQTEGGREALAVVEGYRAIWTAPPERIPSNSSVDAPLLGNGDLAVTIGGAAGAPRFFLSKNDFWRLRSRYGEAGPRPVATIDVIAEGFEAGTYRVEQQLADATTVTTLATDERSLKLTSWVAATRNVFVVTLAAEGGPVAVELRLAAAAGNGAQVREGYDQASRWIERRFDRDVDIPTAAAVAIGTSQGTGPWLDVIPARPVTVVAGVASRFEDADPAARARAIVAASRGAHLADLWRAHEAWWTSYWAQSWVEIGDAQLERAYYQALYTMASGSRDPRFPPPIFGTWITTDTPSWHGDYHLNYNHMAPFYGLYSANRIEQADPQDAPLLDFRARGRWYAEKVTGTRGVLYPVGVGPLGIETTRHSPHTTQNVEGGLFFGQKSNAAYCLVNLAQRWYSTYDLAWARRTYPFVLEVIEFWDDYLRLEDGRYVIHDDAVHEGSGDNFNSILSLGLVRNAFALVLDMSRELDVDADRRETWKHVLAHLSGYATQERDGEEVFRYTERGTDWWRDNTLGIQHIYPAGQIGLDSDPELLRVARNTIRVMNRWIDFNGSNSFFPAAVRVGYDPEVILARLRDYVRHTYPNGFQRGNPHGIENCSTVPNTINEMLCSAHGHVLRVFPNWPRTRDARFRKIRTWGAFLVDAALRDGEVQYIRLVSERGRDCVLVNPWPGEAVRVHRSDGGSQTVTGERLTLSTEPGEEVLLGPAGTSRPTLWRRRFADR